LLSRAEYLESSELNWNSSKHRIAITRFMYADSCKYMLYKIYHEEVRDNQIKEFYGIIKLIVLYFCRTSSYLIFVNARI